MTKYGIYNHTKHRTIVFDELIKARRYAMKNWKDVMDNQGFVPICYHPSKTPTEIMRVVLINGNESIFFTDIIHIDGSPLYEVNQKSGRVVRHD